MRSLAFAVLLVLGTGAWGGLGPTKWAEGGAYDYNTNPVIGGTGGIYWEDHVSGHATLKLNNSPLATENRQLVEAGDFPVGFPYDVQGSTVLNDGTYYRAGGGTSFNGFPTLYLNGKTPAVPPAAYPSGFPADSTTLSSATLDSDLSVVFLAQYSPSGQPTQFAICRTRNGGNAEVLVRSGSTPIPDATAGTKFSLLAHASVRDGIITFYGEGGGSHGLYQVSGGGVVLLVGSAGTLPNVGAVPSFDRNNISFATDGPDVAFAVAETTGGVWKRVNGIWSVVARANTPIPQGTGNFYYLSSPSLHMGTVAVVGGRDNKFSLPRQAGLYIEDGQGGLKTIINESDKIFSKVPTNFTVADGGRWWNGKQYVAFRALSSQEPFSGIYSVLFAGPPASSITAQPDAVQFRGTSAITIPVLENDQGPEGSTLQIDSVTPPAAGRVKISQGQVIYTPGSKFSGEDTFTYQVSAGGQDSAIGRVTIRNPFQALRGSFNQLVSGPDGGVLGKLSVTLSPSGELTGKLQLASGVYSLRGPVGFDGAFTQSVKRKGGLADLVVNLSINQPSWLVTLAGSVSGDAASYSIAAVGVALPSLPSGVAPGAYNVLLTTPANSSTPHGTGWARALLVKSGSITLKGRLPDNAPFSVSAPLNSEEKATVYLPLKGKPPGLLSGTVVHFSNERPILQAELAWHKPAPANGSGPSAEGWQTTLSAQGALYLQPTAEAPHVLSFSNAANATGLFQAQGEMLDLQATLTFSGMDKVTAGLPAGASLKIDRKTGLWSGSFIRPGERKATKFTGVLQQVENLGGGLFVDGEQTGKVTLVPQ